MADNKDKITELAKFLDENKGKRKFKQSVELAINFKGIDFSKQQNRLSLDVVLPNGRGKVSKVAVFANDRNIVTEAQKNGIEVIDGDSIAELSGNNARLNALLQYTLVAQPSLMPLIAKQLGQFLGPRNKMPKPLLGGVTIANIAGNINKMVTIKNKGKFVPTVHCVVGSEDMAPDKIYDNIAEVLDSITKKVGQNHIRSAYAKLTMSKPIKVA